MASSFLPHTFSNGTYSVTVNADRSIRVKAGDWVSKYAAAIWGDPLVNWDKFKKDRAGSPLPDPNKISVGQTLYLPDPLPGEPGAKRPTKPIGINPVEGAPPKSIPQTRIEQFFRLMKEWLCPVTDWEFKGASGIDLSVSLLAAHYTAIDAKRPTDPEPLRYHAVGGGVGIGFDDLGPGAIAMSPPDLFPGCMSGGWIGKFPTAGRTLSADEICGNYMLFDFSCGFVFGCSFTWMFFGFNSPPQAIMRTIGRYIRGDADSIAVLPSLCQGSVLMAGPTLSTPAFGVSAKIGIMHRKQCVTG